MLDTDDTRRALEQGHLVRFAVALRIRDERDGRTKDIVRYDNYRGFHRHAPGLPPRREHQWITVEPSREIEFTAADLLQNGERYERQARRTGFEVPEDEPEADS